MPTWNSDKVGHDDTVVEGGTGAMTKLVATIQKGKQKKNSLVILDLERRWKLIKP